MGTEARFWVTLSSRRDGQLSGHLRWWSVRSLGALILPHINSLSSHSLPWNQSKKQQTQSEESEKCLFFKRELFEIENIAEPWYRYPDYDKVDKFGRNFTNICFQWKHLRSEDNNIWGEWTPPVFRLTTGSQTLSRSSRTDWLTCLCLYTTQLLRFFPLFLCISQ